MDSSDGKHLLYDLLTIFSESEWIDMSILEVLGRTDSLEEFNNLVTEYRNLVDSMAKDDPDRVLYLLELSKALEMQYQRTHSSECLDYAIDTIKEAIDLAPSENSRAVFMNMLGTFLRLRFEARGAKEDIHQAIMYYQSAIQYHPDKAVAYNQLGSALTERFKSLGIEYLTDLGRAIDVLEEGLTKAEDRAALLETLAMTLAIRSEQTSSMADIDRALSAAKETATADDVNRWSRLVTLGMVLECKFSQTESVQDLKDAVQAAEEASDLAPDDHSRARIFDHLATVFILEFQHFESREALESSLKISKQALSLSMNDPRRSIYLSNYSASLIASYQLMGNAKALDDAIEALDKAIKLTTENDSKRSTMLNNISEALRFRYYATGDIENLNRAIDECDKALQVTPSSHTERSMRLSTLALALDSRFELTGSMRDSNRAVTLLEEAASIISDPPLAVSRSLSNLADVLQSRAERTRSMDDLRRAIDCYERSLSLHVTDHAQNFNNLGHALQLLYDLTESKEAVQQAIEKHEKSLELAQLDYPYRQQFCNNLASAYLKKFKITSAQKDLESAIENFELALEQKYDSGRSLFLLDLGTALELKYQRTKSRNDFDRALKCFKEAVEGKPASPTTRVKAAQAAVDLLLPNLEFVDPKLSEILKIAVELLPAIVPRTIDWDDQQYNIAQAARLASVAAAFALGNGESAFEALRLLELGRGVMASRQLELRSDIGVLEEKYPKLAARFIELRDEIEQPRLDDRIPTWSGKIRPSRSTRLHSASKEFDVLIQEIRSKSGMERFLLGPPEADFMSLAVHPIVALNVTPLRSDALIVTRSSIRSIPLPKLAFTELERHDTELNIVLDTMSLRTYRNANRKLDEVLKWLWDVAVEPILLDLGFTSVPKDVWPRICWVSTGRLSGLPIHAAGYHKNSTRNALDRVISSYMPTINALFHTREEKTVQSVLIVGMATTPGESALPNVNDEIQAVKDAFLNIKPLIHTEPTKEKVLRSMQSVDVAHFACHGVSVRQNPSESRLLLTDWQTDPLTVADVVKLKLNARLAFLSTCHSSKNRMTDLLDEGIHLTGAFQLAGFSHVIGTLWRIDDKESVQFARSVYQFIRNDTSLTAKGVHQAIRELRDVEIRGAGYRRRLRDDPQLWAAYIHMGR